MLLDQFTTTVVAAGTGDEAGVAATPNMRLMGWSIKETAAAVATMSILHGASSAGTALAHLNFAASGSDTQWFGPQGIPCPNGVWLERLTGNTAVVLYTKVVS
jgi:hypothetical protein